ADDQRAVRDAPAEFRMRHVLLVDVVHREISGDPGKEVDVSFPDRLGERDGIPDLDVKVLHGASRSIKRSSPCSVSIRWRGGARHHVSSIATTPSRSSAAIAAG